MNICNIVRKYGKSKGAVIKGMINEKLKEKYQKEMTAVQRAKQTNLEPLRKRRDDANKKANELTRQLSNKCDKLHIMCYNKKWSYHNSGCYLCGGTERKIQNASNLFALGRKKEAKEIYDGLIEKFELVELKK